LRTNIFNPFTHCRNLVRTQVIQTTIAGLQGPAQHLLKASKISASVASSMLIVATMPPRHDSHLRDAVDGYSPSHMYRESKALETIESRDVP
jgi:hypothetical protein